MLSTVATQFPTPDPTVLSLCLDFGTGFTPWDFTEDICSTQFFSPVISNSGSVEPNQNHTNASSGSYESNRPVSLIEERKKRRMMSNRESARRSRMRKRRHVENLRSQMNRLRMENRVFENRVRFILYHCDRVRTENARLLAEHNMLSQKLSEIRQILLINQLQQQFPPSSSWPCNNVNVIFGGKTQPLIA